MASAELTPPPIVVTPTNAEKKSLWSFGVSRLSPSRRSVDVAHLEKQKKNSPHYDYSNLSFDFNNSVTLHPNDQKPTNNHDISNNNLVCGAPEILSRTQDTSIQAGNSVLLSCHISNHESSKIAWRKSEPNPMAIHSSPKFMCSVTNTGEARLIINQTVPQDSGLYVCAVSNQLGIAQCTIGLTVVAYNNSNNNNITEHDSTQMHSAEINLEIVNPTSVRVSWDFTSSTTNSFIIEYCRLGTMQWMRNEEKPVRSRYILTGLTPGESYTFRLLCANTNVASLPSSPVTMPLSENHMWQQQQFNNRYIALSELGRGRFSVIRLASDCVTGQKVALKQVLRRHQDLITTQEEYKILASAQHPNVVRGLALFENAPHQGIDTIVMEL